MPRRVRDALRDVPVSRMSRAIPGMSRCSRVPRDVPVSRMSRDISRGVPGPAGSAGAASPPVPGRGRAFASTGSSPLTFSAFPIVHPPKIPTSRRLNYCSLVSIFFSGSDQFLHLKNAQAAGREARAVLNLLRGNGHRGLPVGMCCCGYQGYVKTGTK